MARININPPNQKITNEGKIMLNHANNKARLTSSWDKMTNINVAIGNTKRYSTFFESCIRSYINQIKNNMTKKQPQSCNENPTKSFIFLF